MTGPATTADRRRVRGKVRGRALRGWPARLRREVERLARTLRVGRPPSERPLPRVGLRLGPHLPGWALRLGLALVAAACADLVVTGPWSRALAVAGVLAVVLRPGGASSGVFVVGVGAALAAAPAGTAAPRSAVLLLGLHLVVQLALVAARVGWTVLLELRVLLGPARRFLLLQAGSQLLGLGGAALAGQGVVLPGLLVLAVVGLTVLSWGLLSRLQG